MSLHIKKTYQTPPNTKYGKEDFNRKFAFKQSLKVTIRSNRLYLKWARI